MRQTSSPAQARASPWPRRPAARSAATTSPPARSGSASPRRSPADLREPIHNAQTGVSYQAAAALSDNSIHDNATGVISNVAAVASGFGFVGSTSPIRSSTIARACSSTTPRCRTSTSTTTPSASTGSGVLGGTDLDYANVHRGQHRQPSISAAPSSTTASPRNVGIEAQSAQLIAYNVIYATRRPAST